MFHATLVSTLALLLTQGSIASADPAHRVVTGEHQQAQVRSVQVKSEDSDRADEARKESIRQNGFFWTIFEDIKAVVIGPFTWAWSVITFPFTMSLLSKYRFDLYQESKADAASS